MTQLPDCAYPVDEPSCRSRRLRRRGLKFPSKANQVVRDVNVVEGLCEARRQLKGLGSRQQFVERAPCSHPIVFEERRMGSLGADKIVASVVGRPDNHIARSQSRKSAIQNQRREVWAIAVEGNNALLDGSGEMCKNRIESRGKAFTLLSYDLSCSAQEVRQFIRVRFRAHNSYLHATQRLCQRHCVL